MGPNWARVRGYGILALQSLKRWEVSGGLSMMSLGERVFERLENVLDSSSDVPLTETAKQAPKMLS